MSIYSVIYLNIMQLPYHLSHIDYKSIYFYCHYLFIMFPRGDLIGNSLIYRGIFFTLLIAVNILYIYLVFHLP